jgi:predicted dehydrogenase
VYQSKKIVLFGAGYWGTNIANTLIKIGVKKLWIYDLNNKNSNTLKSRFPMNIEIISDINQFYKNDKFKYFIFATPPSTNFRLIKKALINNKIIFIEKPGFKNLSEINFIIKNFPNQSKFIMFGYIYMFNNYIDYIRKFIQDKNNGKILYIKFQRQNLGPIRNDVDVSYDLSSHDLSIIKFLFPKNKIKILKNQKYKLLNNKIADISNLSLKLGKFFIDINNSWINPDKIRKIIIITEKKMLIFNEILLTDKVKIYNKFASYPKVELLKNNFFNRKIKIHFGTNFSPKIINNDPLKDELKYFLNFDKNNKIKSNMCIIFAKEILKLLDKLK